jgi:hypothetical protein
MLSGKQEAKMVGKTLTPDQQRKLAAELGKKARATSSGARVSVGKEVDDQGNVKTTTVTFKETVVSAPPPKRRGK